MKMYDNAMSYANAMHEYDKWWMHEWYVHYDAMKRCMMQSRNMPEWVFYMPPNPGT